MFVALERGIILLDSPGKNEKSTSEKMSQVAYSLLPSTKGQVTTGNK